MMKFLTLTILVLLAVPALAEERDDRDPKTQAVNARDASDCPKCKALLVRDDRAPADPRIKEEAQIKTIVRTTGDADVKGVGKEDANK